jgi:hypothetical protein
MNSHDDAPMYSNVHAGGNALDCKIVKRVTCPRCNVPFFESYDSKRKYHLSCEPPQIRQKRMSREVNH